MPDTLDILSGGLVPRTPNPSERVRLIAQRSNVSPDIADDYLKTTQIESGHNINVRDSSKGAQGFGQVMPDVKGGTTRTVGGRRYNLRNPDENIEAGLRYFAEGGGDPVSRRLHYFGGPRARQTYERTGRIPNISDGNMTATQYVKATGGVRRTQEPSILSGGLTTKPDTPADVPDILKGGLVEAPEPTPQGSWASNLYNQKPRAEKIKPKPWRGGTVGQGIVSAPMLPNVDAMPSRGNMPGRLHLNEQLAPKVRPGAPRPFAPGEWVDNPNGSWSSEISSTVQNSDGSWSVVPGMWLVNGKPQRVNEDVAARYAQASGLSFPKYKTLDDAEKFATDRESAWQGIKPQEASRIAPLWQRGDISQATVTGEAQPSDATNARLNLRRVTNAGGVTGGLAALVPTQASDFVDQMVAEGTAGLMERGAGFALQAPGLPMGAGAPVAQRIRAGAQAIRQGSQAIDKDTIRAGVNVPVLGRVTTKDIQNVGSGAIASAPALALQRLGVPAPIAFGLDAYLASTGRGEELSAALKEAGLGAATGGLYEIPLPRAAKATILRQIGAKLGLGAAGGYGLAKAFGVSEEEARKNAAVTALFMASGAGKSQESIAQPLVPEALQTRLRANEAKTETQPNITAQPESISTQSGAITHASLQPRKQRGEGKGQFKAETKAQAEERRAQVTPVEQTAEPATPERQIPPIEAAQPVPAETTASMPSEVVVFDSAQGRRAVDLPPAQEGLVRLYRGEPSPSQESYGSRAVSDAPADVRGRWFSTDPQEAADYAAANDVKGGGLMYVDLPANEAMRYKAQSVAGGRKISPFPLRENEFILPSELAEKAIGIPSRQALESESAKPYAKQTDATSMAQTFYHATSGDFDEFKPGSHFGTAEAANARSRYSRAYGPRNVRPVKLKIDNPLRVKDNGTENNVDSFIWSAEKSGAISKAEADSLYRDSPTDKYQNDYPDEQRFYALLKSKGYDGLVYENATEDWGNDSYVVFDGSQVQPALAKHAPAPQEAPVAFTKTHQGPAQVAEEDMSVKSPAPGVTTSIMPGDAEPLVRKGVERFIKERGKDPLAPFRDFEEQPTEKLKMKVWKDRGQEFFKKAEAATENIESEANYERTWREIERTGKLPQEAPKVETPAKQVAPKTLRQQFNDLSAASNRAYEQAKQANSARDEATYRAKTEDAHQLAAQAGEIMKRLPEAEQAKIKSKALGSMMEGFAKLGREAPKTAEPIKPTLTPASEPLKLEPDVKVRSFPQTLAETGREKGNDLYYEEVTDKDAVARANQRIEADPEAARQYVLKGRHSPQGKERIATGLRLADDLIADAGKESDPVIAADKHAQAVELYSKLAGDLTTAGQTVQAANLARRYSPAGAILEATRVAGETRLKPEVAQSIRELAQKHQAAESRINDLEMQIEQMRSRLKNADSGKPRSFREKAETLQDRFAKLETEARARLEARKASGGVRGSEAGATTVIPDIVDFSIIGASKLARGGLDFAKWSDEMVKDLGEEIRPHLNSIFQASHKRLDDERASVRSASAERSATKILTRQGKEISPETIKAALEEKANLQAERRQARVDLDRHFRELEDAGKNTGTKIATSMLRDGLLSLHGYLKILSGMSAKQVADTAARATESITDTARVRGAQLFGRETPRTSTAASVGPRGLKYTTDYLAREGTRNVAAAIRGKSSEIMPAHGGITGNAYADAAIAPMQRLYASKEAIFRSWAYPQERYNQASILARNDSLDGLISRGNIPERTKDYLSGRLEVEGGRNKQYVEAMAKNAAQYEIRSKQIIRSTENARTKELASSPRELIDSLARQYADTQVYAQPNRVSEIVQGTRGIMRKGGLEKPFEVAQATVLPFVKRPANAVADAVYTYTGARIPVEALRNTLGRGWGPAEIRSFNQAIARGGAGAGLFAVGMALGKKGVLTPSDDKKSINVKRASGYQDGSIHVGDNYYQIKNVPFVGWLLVAGATAQRRGFGSVPGAVTNMIAEHPLIRSGVETFDTVKNYLTSPEKQAAKAPEAAARWGSRFIPSLVNAAGEATDTKTREVKGVAAQFESRIPVLRATLPPQRDVFGADIPKSRASFISPFRLSEGRETPATREMIRLHVDIGMPKQKDKETAVQFQKYKETVGPLLKKNLNDLVQTRGYKQLSDEKKADALHIETKRIEEEVRKRITPEGKVIRGALPRKRSERTARPTRLVIP